MRFVRTLTSVPFPAGIWCAGPAIVVAFKSYATVANRNRLDATQCRELGAVLIEAADYMEGRATVMSHRYHLHRNGNPCPTYGTPSRPTEVLIGHSAMGWVFMWRGHHSAEESPLGVVLETPDQWFEVLRRETELGALIVDTYGKSCSFEQFRDYVLCKRLPRLLPDGEQRLPQRHSDLNAHQNPDSSSRECVNVDGDDMAFYDFG